MSADRVAMRTYAPSRVIAANSPVSPRKAATCSSLVAVSSIALRCILRAKCELRVSVVIVTARGYFSVAGAFGSTGGGTAFHVSSISFPRARAMSCSVMNWFGRFWSSQSDPGLPNPIRRHRWKIGWCGHGGARRRVRSQLVDVPLRLLARIEGEAVDLRIDGVPGIARVEEGLEQRARRGPALEDLPPFGDRRDEDQRARRCLPHCTGGQDEQTRLPPRLAVLEVDDGDLAGCCLPESVQDLPRGAVGDRFALDATIYVDPEVDAGRHRSGEVDLDPLEAEASAALKQRVDQRERERDQAEDQDPNQEQLVRLLRRPGAVAPDHPREREQCQRQRKRNDCDRCEWLPVRPSAFHPAPVAPNPTTVPSRVAHPPTRN